jgi:hypothetical protein
MKAVLSLIAVFLCSTHVSGQDTRLLVPPAPIVTAPCAVVVPAQPMVSLQQDHTYSSVKRSLSVSLSVGSGHISDCPAGICSTCIGANCSPSLCASGACSSGIAWPIKGTESGTSNYIPIASLPQRIQRMPVGHTHTCVNGHTWDHSVTSSHQCPECGASQYVQDSRPRMVNVAPRKTNLEMYDAGRTSVHYASGGCASGQCSTSSSSTGRVGIFKRLLGN